MFFNVATEETLDTAFLPDGILRARAETRKAIAAIASEVRPGMAEEDAIAIADRVIGAQGYFRYRHPTRIRFGVNTTKSVRQSSVPDVVLRENDIFFIDIAPLVGDWEGDGGASFVVGNVADHARCTADAERLFHEVRHLWEAVRLSGKELYTYAAGRAREMGWRLNSDCRGHRISDVPHAAVHTGSLADYPARPCNMGWILEIHLMDPEGRFGAFFADMLLSHMHGRWHMQYQ